MQGECFKTLKKKLRHVWVEKATRLGVTNLCNLIKLDSDAGIAADGHVQEMKRCQVVFIAVSQSKTCDRLNLQSGDLLDLFELCMQHMYQQELHILEAMNNVIAHVDATGSIVRKPQYLICKRILCYTLLVRHTNDIIKSTHMITSEHGVLSVSKWLKAYRYFSMKKVQSKPLSKCIVSDWSWVLVHSILIEFNDMTLIDYLVKLFDYLQTDTSLP